MAAKFGIVLVASAALGVSALLATATAQPGPGPGFMGPGMMSGPGMMGSGMMGRRGFGAMCNPGATGFAEWRADRIAELVKLTDAQRQLMNSRQRRSSRPRSCNVCQTDVLITSGGLTPWKPAWTRCQAIRTMWPALEAFYATLSDDK
jgi:hypothetical protein